MATLKDEARTPRSPIGRYLRERFPPQNLLALKAQYRNARAASTPLLLRDSAEGNPRTMGTA
jgi:hypothetical protein